MRILVPGNYTYSGSVNAGANVIGRIPVDTVSASCSDIQNALNTYQSGSNDYPVQCDFINLSGTGVVFFMNASTQQLENSLEVSTVSGSYGFTDADLDYIYSLETGFVCFLIVVMTFARNFRKYKSKRLKYS